MNDFFKNPFALWLAEKWHMSKLYFCEVNDLSSMIKQPKGYILQKLKKAVSSTI